jgi:hypothetical protein
MVEFEILQSNEGTINGILPGTAHPRGTPLMISAVNADTGQRTFALADGKCDGFMTRASRTAPVRTDTEVLFPDAALETPFLAGSDGTIETEVTELNVEGSTFIKGSSTGAITSGTAAGTKLGFDAGKFYVAQTGELAQWELVAQLTPETGGNTKIRVKRLSGYLVP